MNEDIIETEFFLFLILTLLLIGVAIIITSARMIYNTKKREGLTKKVLEDGTVEFLDKDGNVSIIINPRNGGKSVNNA